MMAEKAPCWNLKYLKVILAMGRGGFNFLCTWKQVKTYGKLDAIPTKWAMFVQSCNKYTLINQFNVTW